MKGIGSDRIRGEGEAARMKESRMKNKKITDEETNEKKRSVRDWSCFHSGLLVFSDDCGMISKIILCERKIKITQQRAKRQDGCMRACCDEKLRGGSGCVQDDDAVCTSIDEENRCFFFQIKNEGQSNWASTSFLSLYS